MALNCASSVSAARLLRTLLPGDLDLAGDFGGLAGETPAGRHGSPSSRAFAAFCRARPWGTPWRSASAASASSAAMESLKSWRKLSSLSTEPRVLWPFLPILGAAFSSAPPKRSDIKSVLDGAGLGLPPAGPTGRRTSRSPPTVESAARR